MFLVNVGIMNTESGGNSIVSSIKYSWYKYAHHLGRIEDNGAGRQGGERVWKEVYKRMFRDGRADVLISVD
jgi:hypothetical protein